MKVKSMKNQSQNSIKTMLKNRPIKNNKYSRMPPKWDQESDFILGEIPLGAPLVVQTVFVIKKWAPSAAKVLPMIEK